jgi:hypothetical protein
MLREGERPSRRTGGPRYRHYSFEAFFRVPHFSSFWEKWEQNNWELQINCHPERGRTPESKDPAVDCTSKDAKGILRVHDPVVLRE